MLLSLHERVTREARTSYSRYANVQRALHERVTLFKRACFYFFFSSSICLFSIGFEFSL